MVKAKSRRRTLGSLSMLLNPGKSRAGTNTATPAQEKSVAQIEAYASSSKSDSDRASDSNTNDTPSLKNKNLCIFDADKENVVSKSNTLKKQGHAQSCPSKQALPPVSPIKSCKESPKFEEPSSKEEFQDSKHFVASLSRLKSEKRVRFAKDVPCDTANTSGSSEGVDVLVESALIAQVEQLRNENSDLKRELTKSQKKSVGPSPRTTRVVQRQAQSLSTLEAQVKAQQAARATLESHVGFLTKRYRDKKDALSVGTHAESGIWWERCCMLSEEINGLRARDSEKQTAIASLQGALQRSEESRRALHEQSMTLRGNMRVYCRLRPCAGSHATYEFTDGQRGGLCRELRVLAAEELSTDGCSTKSKAWSFEFDRVFRSSSPQEEVYAEVQGLVQSALDGFNVCVFAYGQTSSGKTHTMFGGAGQSEGIVPRALRELTHASRTASGLALSLSILEIYNDQVFDLLSAPAKAKETKRDALQIRNEKSSSRTFVEGLSRMNVDGCDHALALVTRALSSRSVARTRANDRSSRSHTVLTLDIANAETGKHSCVHLVDLAGSERLGQAGSGSDSKLFKETVHINSSLTALKNALRCLAIKQAHVPYRDSKLTYLLQNALQSHSCKTLMICTISQNNEHLQESVNSLRFSENVLKQRA